MANVETNSDEEISLQAEDRVNPFHPGEILKSEFLEPAGMTQKELADKIDVYYPRVNQIINKKRGITVNTAARLSKVFDTTPEFWMKLQYSYELHQLKNDESWEAIESIQPAV